MLSLLKFVHFLSLAAGIGIGIANMVLGIRAAAAEGPVMGALRSAQGVLSKIALAAIVLLWITGFWMWQAFYGGDASALFTAKIAAVIVLTGLSVDLNRRGVRAAKGGTPMDPAYAKRAGMIMGLMSISAVGLAILNFG